MSGLIAGRTNLVGERRPVCLEALEERRRQGALFRCDHGLQRGQDALDTPVSEICWYWLAERLQSGNKSIANTKNKTLGSRTDHDGRGLKHAALKVLRASV